MFEYYEWLIVALPALGALLNGLLGARLSRRGQNGIACGAVAIALLAALPMFAGQALQPGLVGQPEAIPWFRTWTGQRFIEGPLVLYVDALSIFVALATLTAGLFVHLYLSRTLPASESRHLSLALLNATVAALVLAATAGNLWCFFLGWSVSGWGTCHIVHVLGASRGRGAEPSRDRPLGRGAARSPGTRMLLLFLAGDLCLLLAIVALNELLASLSIDDITLLRRPTIPDKPVPEGLTVVVLLVIAAVMIRSVQFPFHSCVPEAGGIVYALGSLAPCLWLIIRMRPLIERTWFGAAVLSWWSAISALLLALAALAQPDVRRLTRLAGQSLGGCCLLALGLGAQAAAVSFFPAYALLQAAVQRSQDARVEDPRARAAGHSMATPAARGTIVLGLIALSGFPLLPGFAFCANLIARAFAHNAALWVAAMLVAGLPALLASKAARQTGPRRAAASGSPGLLTVASGLAVILGWLNLGAPPLSGLFLEPALNDGIVQPAWWWFLIAPIVCGLGAAVGYAIGPQPGVAVGAVLAWLARANGFAEQACAAVARSLLATGHFVADRVEARAADWSRDGPDALLRKVERPETAPSVPLHLVLLLLLLGTILIAAYLVLAR